LTVRWPGGRQTTTPLTAAVREILVDTDGRVVKSTPR
jgi:hypothetical protein